VVRGLGLEPKEKRPQQAIDLVHRDARISAARSDLETTRQLGDAACLHEHRLYLDESARQE
jgi:hypothetical protein